MKTSLTTLQHPSDRKHGQQPLRHKNSLTIEDLFRQINRPIILTSNGLMLPGDPSALQKVSELKPIAIIAGNLLCGLRFESPSGETGNMVAPSDLGKNAIIYQGDTAGE
ncbi:hypothetical protein FOYG_00218 [Fusarium oxysporum NRRL 32931]|uniref:Uncharacterized protein n=1 Tax=Fusarium oxysporum NRRL 32931 TaxID=660029 RepID=W9J694_FUSOX|nr:hypothetical protein FOYG_00218 [Fusarium oxysporum NRRL 32931]